MRQESGIEFALQSEQRGTGDAVRAAGLISLIFQETS